VVDPKRIAPYLRGMTQWNPRLSFKEMCARFDVTPRTLRYYDEIELLSPERAGRARWYGPREVARMTLILRGRRFGFGLEEIRRWLEMYQQRGKKVQLRSFVDGANDRMAAIAEEIARLNADLAELQQLRATAVAELMADAPKPRV
jgi:DNA-binding transcriptional MerR regulator